MKKLGAKGFTALELVLIVVVVGLLGFAGWTFYSRQKDDNKQTSTEITNFEQCAAAGNPIMESYPEQCSANGKTFTRKLVKMEIKPTAVASNGYLVIKEWGVKIKVDGPIQDASYYFVNSNAYSGPSAFLSTSALDNSEMCSSYYRNTDPTFQDITRYTLGEPAYGPVDATYNTALEATQQSPEDFIRVGDFVYQYRHGNGMPCPDETDAQRAAFQAAFATIQPE